MNDANISTFLLERYRIGEVTAAEKFCVEEAIAKDKTMAAALADMDRADNNFLQRFPMDTFFTSGKNFQNESMRGELLYKNQQSVLPRIGKARIPQRNFPRIKPALVWGVSAASVILAVIIPLFVLKTAAHTELADRIKGKAVNEPFSSIHSGSIADNGHVELSVYIRGNAAGEGIRLEERSGVREGNTIQLVYSVSGDNLKEKYGVIFSVDGRSYVTLHYPYNARQDTQLVSGKIVPLDEAYTLDDAPDYEIFFFVTGNKPMDAGNILTSAKQLALQIQGQSNEAERLGTVMFSEYDVKVFTLIKE